MIMRKSTLILAVSLLVASTSTNQGVGGELLAPPQVINQPGRVWALHTSPDESLLAVVGDSFVGAYALHEGKLSELWRSETSGIIYAVQLADDIWVVHAFQKKTTGIKTPKYEIDLIRNRLKSLKEMLT